MKSVCVYYCDELSVRRPRRPTHEGITSKPSKSTNGHRPPLPSAPITPCRLLKSHRFSTSAISMNKHKIYLPAFNRFPSLTVVHLLSACLCSFSNQSADSRRKSPGDLFSKGKHAGAVEGDKRDIQKKTWRQTSSWSPQTQTGECVESVGEKIASLKPLPQGGRENIYVQMCHALFSSN